MVVNPNRLYGGKDPRDLPAYSIADAAHYIGVNPSTLGFWIRAPNKPAHGIVRPAKLAPKRTLSFWNLIELAILTGIRRHEGLPLQRIRKAIRGLEEDLGVPRPLISERFVHDGLNLFVERLGVLIRADDAQLVEVEAHLSKRLKRVTWDADHLARSFFIRSRSADEDTNLIELDPRRAFGRPVIVGTGIEVSALVERYTAGDAIALIAEDFSLEAPLVEEAIRSCLVAA